MTKLKGIRITGILLFAVILAGNIFYQNYEKKMLSKRIADAAEKLDMLVNLHFTVSTADESEQEEKSGTVTEVWADLDSGKWVAVYSSVEGDSQTVYQSEYYDGKKTYGCNDTVRDWTELAEMKPDIPYFSALHTFYYNEEDFSQISVSRTEGKTIVTASLAPSVLEKVQENGVESANQTYLSYLENGQEQETEAAALLLECAKQTQVTAIEVSYTIDEEGMLCESTYKEQYSSPAIITENGETVLGELQEHTVTTVREVTECNSEAVTETLQQYLNQSR